MVNSIHVIVQQSRDRGGWTMQRADAKVPALEQLQLLFYYLNSVSEHTTSPT